jgi:hypothetical protein
LRELYRPIYRCLSAKLVPTFVDRGVPRGQRDGSLRLYSRFSRPESLLFLPSSSSIVPTRLSTRYRRWLKHYTTSWMVADSSPDEFTKFFDPQYGPRVYPAFNRNEFQKIFLRVKRGQRLRLTIIPLSVSRLSRQCGILNIS